VATFHIDGGRITSREAFWDAFVTVVQPEGAESFGRNLAALNDALWGGPGWPGDNFILQISNATALEGHLGPEFVEKLRDVFAHSHSARLVLD
jgi:RNAse (barnase) inhibitor barstar